MAPAKHPRTIILICTTTTELDTEYADIEAAIRRARHRDCFALMFTPAATLEALIGAMNYHRPTLLHVVGHGTPDGLVLPLELASPSATTHEVGPDHLARLLRPFAPELRCIVLNACHTRDHAQTAAGTVDAGIGVHGVVFDDEARAFSRSLYDAIASGLSLGDAFEQASLLTNSPHELHVCSPEHAGLRFASGVHRDDDRHVTITLNIDLFEVDATTLEQIMAAIHQTVQEHDVRRRLLSSGSTKLEIQTTAAGARALLEAHATGRLSSLAGIEVLGIEEHGDLDLELLMRWRSGSNVAGDRLLARNHQRVSSLIARSVGQRPRFELTAKTFECLRAPGFAWDCGSFLALVFGHARSVLHEYLGDGEREPTLPEVLAHSSDPVLTESMWTLPLDDKLLLELHYWHHLSVAELSEVLALSDEQVRERLTAIQHHVQAELRTREPSSDATFDRRIRAAAAAESSVVH